MYAESKRAGETAIERAGYRGNDAIPPVYIEYERLRMEKGAVGYDDFVPLAVQLLKGSDVAVGAVIIFP